MNLPLVPIHRALSAIALATAMSALSALSPPSLFAAERSIPPSTGARALTVTIVSGTYGPNCGAPPGNLTADLARRCNGRDTCSYPIPANVAQPDRPACRASFVAEWRCGQDEPHLATLATGAMPGDRLVMSCVRYGGAGK